MAMPRATTAWLGRPVVAAPSKVIEPPAGATTPAIARSAEVLPAPFEPMMPTNSPARTSRSTPRTASMRPYATLRPSTLSSASLIAARSASLRRHRLPGCKLGAAGAEIGLDHLRIVLHLRRAARRDHAAIVEDGDMIRHGHHHLHVMLDQDHGHAVVGEQPDQRLEVLDLTVREARRRL